MANRQKNAPKFRFGIWSLLLFMFVCAVTSAAGSYLMKQDSKTNRGVFVIFAFSAPVIVLVLVSVAYRATRLLKKSRRIRKKR